MSASLSPHTSAGVVGIRQALGTSARRDRRRCRRRAPAVAVGVWPVVARQRVGQRTVVVGADRAVNSCRRRRCCRRRPASCRLGRRRGGTPRSLSRSPSPGTVLAVAVGVGPGRAVRQVVVAASRSCRADRAVVARGRRRCSRRHVSGAVSSIRRWARRRCRGRRRRCNTPSPSNPGRRYLVGRRPVGRSCRCRPRSRRSCRRRCRRTRRRGVVGDPPRWARRRGRGRRRPRCTRCRWLRTGRRCPLVCSASGPKLSVPTAQSSQLSPSASRRHVRGSCRRDPAALGHAVVVEVAVARVAHAVAVGIRAVVARSGCSPRAKLSVPTAQSSQPSPSLSPHTSGGRVVGIRRVGHAVVIDVVAVAGVVDALSPSLSAPSLPGRLSASTPKLSVPTAQSSPIGRCRCRRTRRAWCRRDLRGAGARRRCRDPDQVTLHHAVAVVVGDRRC